MPIHYVSRSLQGAETNYAPMEKLALALVHAARRLRRYFQAHPIKVITDSPIGQVLNNSGASGRLAKWAVELGAYGITYVVNNPRVEDILESSNAREDLTPGPRAWKLYTDGASNNEGSGAGLILIALDDAEYPYALRLNFSNSNNDAEYEALLDGLRIANEMQVKDIHAFVDSKLVASQVEGKYKAKGERMIKYREKALELAGAFNRSTSKGVNERSVEAQEVNMVVEEEGPTWMTPIRNYLEKGKLPEDPVDARTLMEKIGNYTMDYLVPLMSNNASVPNSHEQITMISITSAWPFMKWGMDIVGPLPEGPRRVKYLIVAIDYFTKWMEAKPLATITGKQVVNFTYDNIVCRFGIPATIITDNGTQFVNDPFKKWAEKLKIQLISTSVYHPHGNGVVERVNKSLLRGIKTRLEKGRSAWAEESP
ncbi:reverse transcriptase domain-containing protein [Tanacetum coccineum]